MYNLFPNLSKDAKKILVIEKNAVLTDDKLSMQSALKKINHTVYEDDNYVLLEIKQIEAVQ